MARVQYGGIELSQVRLLNMDVEAARDPSNIDVTMQKVSMDLAFEWGPAATASVGAGIPVIGQPVLQGGQGDRLGLSIRSLKDTLSTDRLPFIYAIGPDVVFEAPGKNPFGQRLPCDPGNGPITGKLSIFNITGEKSAQGRWRITFFVPLGENILLSNRWSAESVTNAAGFTTRTISGRAVMRADAADDGTNSPPVPSIDSFRKWFLCPVPNGFRREKVRCLVDEAGLNAAYTCIDKQTANPLGSTGARIRAVKIEGNATAGSQSKFNKRTGVFQFAASAVMGNFSFFDSIPVFLDKARAYITHESINPLNTASCMVRITAGQQVPKSQLLRLGTAICLDRFPNGNVIEAHATQGLCDGDNEGRWVELRFVYLNNIAVATATLFNIFDFESQMNFSNDISIQFPGDPQFDMTFFGSTANNNPLYQNYNLPKGTRPSDLSGSRGNWLGAMISQALQEQGDAPFLPPENEDVTQVGLY